MNHQKDFEIQSTLEKTRKLVFRARYGDALKAAEDLYLRYPREPMALYLYGAHLGDFTDGLSVAKIEQNRKKAASLLGRAAKKIDLVPRDYRSRVLNEYYWFSQQRIKQYRNGLKTVAAGNKRGYYGAGVGSAAQSLDLMRSSRPADAIKWAKTSEKCWKTYLRSQKDYYNPYCWYARALGYQGNYKGMDKALEEAVRLSGQPAEAPEFTETRREVFEFRDLYEHKMKMKPFECPPRPRFWFVTDPKVRKKLVELHEVENGGSVIESFRKSQILRKMFPKHVYANCMAAALWGDLGQFYDQKTELKMKAQAAARIRSLIPKLKNEHHRVHLSVWNELYYHTADYLNQYKLGVRRHKEHYGTGYFSMGVGAAEFANELFIKGQTKKAQIWAKKSVAAWEAHGLGLKNNAFYAEALGLIGRKKEARKIAKAVRADQLIVNGRNRWADRLEQRLDAYEKAAQISGLPRPQRKLLSNSL